MALLRNLALVMTIALGVGLMLAAACGGGDDNGNGSETPSGTAGATNTADGTPEATVPPTDTPLPTLEGQGTPRPESTPTAQELAAVQALAQQALDAIQQRSHEQLRALLSIQLRDLFDDSAMDRIFQCIGESTVAVPPFGEVLMSDENNSRATIRVNFDVLVGEERRVVDREWILALENGQWRVDRPIPCPPKEPDPPDPDN